jgi:hypothetical protein
MNDHLNLLSSEVRVRDLREQAELWRLGHPNADAREAVAVPRLSSTLLIRMAHPDDDKMLGRLAQVDGRPPLDHSRLLVAEVEGEVLAALPLDGGAPFADPFRPTASLVEMLKLRAAQLLAEPPRRGLRAWLSRVLGTQAGGRPATAPATPENGRLLIPRD